MKFKKVLIVIMSILLIIGTLGAYYLTDWAPSISLRYITVYFSDKNDIIFSIDPKEMTAEVWERESDNRKIINLDRKKFREYKKFFLDFWGDIPLDIGGSNSSGVKELVWGISIAKHGFSLYRKSGYSKYPEGWSEFVDKTNELLGGEYFIDYSNKADE